MVAIFVKSRTLKGYQVKENFYELRCQSENLSLEGSGESETRLLERGEKRVVSMDVFRCSFFYIPFASTRDDGDEMRNI